MDGARPPWAARPSDSLAKERTPRRERRHRLPRTEYLGTVLVSFTACVADGLRPFMQPGHIAEVLSLMRESTLKFACDVPLYCFMPDLLHVVFLGTSNDADCYSAMIRLKQISGFRMKRWSPPTRWQKDFYDRVIRSDEQRDVLWYVALNPVRAGVCHDWDEYCFTGSIGHDVRSVLEHGVRVGH